MSQLRYAYPGVGPWEWEAHPDWLDRVLCTLLAEREGEQIAIAHAQQQAEK